MAEMAVAWLARDIDVQITYFQNKSYKKDEKK